MNILNWEKNQPTKGIVYPISWEGHTLTYIPKIGIILFGGFGSHRLNDISNYDIKKNLWTIKETTGRQPSPRCYHTTFYEAPFLYIYAGQGDKGNSMGDCCVLNLKTLVWKKLFFIEPPIPRHQHTMVEGINNKTKILFGGMNIPDNKYFNDVWQLDLKNMVYEEKSAEVTGVIW